MTPDQRYQIESRLRRELTPEELVEVANFDDLSRIQLDVVAALAKREGVTPGIYVRGVVPSADHTDARNFVLTIDAFIKAKFSPDPEVPRLSMEEFYERQLGRALSDDERRTTDSLQALSEAHLAVAQTLSMIDPVYGMTYLGDIVPSARPYDREMLAESLRRKGPSR
jgi:hypothetical protein